MVPVLCVLVGSFIGRGVAGFRELRHAVGHRRSAARQLVGVRPAAVDPQGRCRIEIPAGASAPSAKRVSSAPDGLYTMA